MTDLEEGKKEGTSARAGVRTAASTLAGASLGVVSGIGVITAASLAEVLLPVALCLWSLGLLGGAVGLLCGTRKKRG